MFDISENGEPLALKRLSHECTEEGAQFPMLIEWQNVGNVLVRSNYHECPSFAVVKQRESVTQRK
jgi:hypothetical protein